MSNPILESIRQLMDKAMLELRGQLLIAEYDYWTRQVEYLKNPQLILEDMKINE